MKRDVYLSVDLDYWYSKKMGSGLNFVRELFALRRPITVFTEHHLVLKDISKQYRKVYNVDYHSDIGEIHQGWPNCGSWVNYVYGRKNAEFEWRYPNYKECVGLGHGLCNMSHSDGHIDDPFTYKAMHNWKKISRHPGLNEIELDRVDRISLVLSQCWSDWIVIRKTLQYIQKRKVNYYSKSAEQLINRMISQFSEY